MSVFALGLNHTTAPLDLRGRFAVMMLVSGESGALEKLRAESAALAKQTELAVEFHDAPPARKEGVAAAYRLTGTAIDCSPSENLISALPSALARIKPVGETSTRSTDFSTFARRSFQSGR